MLYRNRFAGHVAAEDPRTPVTGAGGCRWPTFPPWRVQLSSTNATGEFTFLNTRPIILEQDPFSTTHDYVNWLPIEQPDEVYNVSLSKAYQTVMHPRIQYWLRITLIGWPSLRVWLKIGTNRCNQSIHWGEQWRRRIHGTTGTGFIAHQVEFDKMRFPGWIPP